MASSLSLILSREKPKKSLKPNRISSSFIGWLITLNMLKIEAGAQRIVEYIFSAINIKESNSILTKNQFTDCRK
jgi:hypothetical protein